MPMTRTQLEERLKRLDVTVGELQAAFWSAFAAETDFATEEAGADDVAWVNDQIDDILRKHNIAVPEDEAPVDG